MIAVANAPSGTTISGPISTRPHGAGAVCRYGELYLGSTSQRTGGVHGSVVGPDRLTRDRQTESGSTGLVGHVRLPDSFQTLGRDALAVVRDGNPYRVPSAHLRRFCRNGDVAMPGRRVHGVEQN